MRYAIISGPIDHNAARREYVAAKDIVLMVSPTSSSSRSAHLRPANLRNYACLVIAGRGEYEIRWKA